ncbi:MAG: ArsC family reductase [Burkholderiales bacterium]
MATIFGIKNCDTMKRAFAWLGGHGVPYTFHDYKKAGVSAGQLRSWAAQAGWEALLNTRGTTWRKLAPEQQAGLDEDKAIALMMANPSLIKRPVLEHGKSLLVGFALERYAALFGK